MSLYTQMKYPNSLYRQVTAWVDISICQATGGRYETNKWTALNLICRMHSQFWNIKYCRCRQIKSNYLSAQQQSDDTFKWKQWKYHEPFRCSIQGHTIISLFTPDIEPKHSNASLPFLSRALSLEFRLNSVKWGISKPFNRNEMVLHSTNKN